MKIPWKSLGSQPTVINIEKVFILISPVPDSEVKDSPLAHDLILMSDNFFLTAYCGS